MHSGHRKTLHSAKHNNAKKSENPLCESISCAAALRRAAHQMTGLGQSLWDPQSLIIGGKPRGNLPVSDCSRVCQEGAEVSPTPVDPAAVSLLGLTVLNVAMLNMLNVAVLNTPVAMLSSSLLGLT